MQISLNFQFITCREVLTFENNLSSSSVFLSFSIYQCRTLTFFFLLPVKNSSCNLAHFVTSSTQTICVFAGICCAVWKVAFDIFCHLKKTLFRLCTLLFSTTSCPLKYHQNLFTSEQINTTQEEENGESSNNIIFSSLSKRLHAVTGCNTRHMKNQLV